MIITKREIEIEATFLLVMVAAVSLFYVVQRNNYHPQFNVASNAASMPVQAEAVSPKITTSSQVSPDGTKKVILKATQNSDSTTSYDVSTTDGNGENEQHVFTKILNSSDNMIIPFNTWSPDDKLFFLQENIGTSKNVYVFEATGAQFAGGEIYLDAATAFAKANTGNNFDVATGWASETLIIINTTKQDGTKGPSYWFEVPSKAVIQLSTEF